MSRMSSERLMYVQFTSCAQGDTISQLNETALANILLYGDSKKRTLQRIAKFYRVLSKYFFISTFSEYYQSTIRVLFHKCLSIK